MRTSNEQTRLTRWVGVAAIVLASCGSPASGGAPPQPTWLSPVADERVLQLERQLRGFDLAMVETGHRYTELFWAGQDENWEAAAYHARKMRLAIENGLERRPKRAASARPFLDGALAAMEGAVASRDRARFETGFRELTAGCNACHAMEEVGFFEVQPPKTRASPIRRKASNP